MKLWMATAACLLASAVSAPVQAQTIYGANPAAGKYAEVNGIKVYYEIYGEGEPLMLFHGNGGAIGSFSSLIPGLAKHFKVIAVDSRAQGKSSDSDAEITYALMASDMSALITQLHLGSVNVVGWSDGGNIGLELALAHPEQVKSSSPSARITPTSITKRRIIKPRFKWTTRASKAQKRQSRRR